MILKKLKLNIYLMCIGFYSTMIYYRMKNLIHVLINKGLLIIFI